MLKLRRRHILTSLASLAIVGALLVPTASFAGKGKHAGKGHKGKEMLDRMCEQISCTEAQAKDIEQVFKALHTDIKPDREAVRELRQQIATEWKSDKPDERKLASLADKIEAHERNMSDRRLEAMLELHSMLTPEQREQLADKLLKIGRH